MMNNLNKVYHKGRYTEWAKHLRPFSKRLCNKRWRKDGKEINLLDDPIKTRKKYRLKRNIEVKITKKYHGNFELSFVSKYRTMRDANNAIKRENITNAEIITKS